jgi:hypothetical protein
VPNVQAPDGTVVNFPDSMKPEEIAGVMQKQFPVGGSGHSDPSYWDDIKAGANSAMDTTGTALQGVGGILQRNGLPGGETISGAGEFLKRNAPEVPQNYHNRGGDIISDLKAGEFSRAAGDVVHGVAGAAPAAGAAIGAGMLGTAVGAPAAVGAGLVGGVMGLGAGAGSRAAEEGKDVPDTGDVVRAIPRAAADAILSGIGPGKLAARSGTALTRAGTMAGVSGVQSGVDQYDTTGKIDPEQVGNAAITGAATAGATEIPGAVRGGARKASDAVMSRVVGAPDDVAGQQSVIRVANGVKAEQAADPSLSLTAAANRTKLTLVEQANRVLQQVKPLIERDDFRDLSREINDAAQRHNNTVNDSTFGLIDSLPVPDAQRAALTEYTRDLNTASTQSFIKNTTGPLQKIGGAVGHVGAIGLGLASGNPLEMAAGVLGHSIAGRIGSGLGAMADRAMGTNTPEVMLRAQAARRALAAAGQDPNAVQSMPMPQMPQAAPPGPPMGGQQGPVNMAPPIRSGMISPDPTTGLPPSPVPVNTPLPAAAGPRQPLPPLKVNTPADVQAAMAQDDGLPPPQKALQAAQAAQATPGAPAPQAPPTGPQSPAWLRYVQNGNAGITHDAALAAAARAEAAGHLPAGQAALLAQHPGGVDPAIAQAIQAHLSGPQGAPQAAPQADQPTIYSPQRYALATNNYHSHVAAEAARLQQAGQTDAAHALLDIAVNHHTQAGKRAARAALPSHIAAQIPDFVVNHGGK